MAEPQHPTIADAKALAFKYRKQGVIILHFDGGTIGTASYGHTRQKCRELAEISDRIFDALIDGAGRIITHEAGTGDTDHA